MRAKLVTAREAGDLTAAAALTDEGIELQQRAHESAMESLNAVPADLRGVLAREVSPDLDPEYAARRLAENPDGFFTLAEVGNQLRDIYLDAAAEARLSKLAERSQAEALAQRLVDSYVGLRVARDLMDLAKGKPIDQAKAEALHELGLTQTTVRDDGTATVEITDDALPLLARSFRADLAKNPGGFKIAFTPGTPGDVAGTFVEGGIERIATAMQGTVAARAKRRVKLKEFEVAVSFRLPTGEQRGTVLKIAARDEADAEARATARVHRGKREVISAEVLNPAPSPASAQAAPAPEAVEVEFEEPTAKKPTAAAAKSPKPQVANPAPPQSLQEERAARVEEMKTAKAPEMRKAIRGRIREIDAQLRQQGGSTTPPPTAPVENSTRAEAAPPADPAEGVEIIPQATGEARPLSRQIGDELFEGLLASRVQFDRIEQKGFPREKRALAERLADALLDEGVKTPEALAKFLDQNYGAKSRAYSQALWNALATVDPALTGAHDWSAIYAPQEQQEQAADPKAEELKNLRTMGEGVGESLRAYLWEQIQAGKTDEAGTPSALLQLAKMVRDAGGLDTKAEAVEFLDRAQAAIEQHGGTEGYQDALLEFVRGEVGKVKHAEDVQGVDSFAEESPAAATLDVGNDDPGSRANETGSRLEKLLQAAAQRMMDEDRGKAVLFSMEEAGRTPQQAVADFWRETYPNLSEPQQRRFERMIRDVTGLAVGDVVATKRREDGSIESFTANTWPEVYPSDSVPDDVHFLEGTERGLIALMEAANMGMGAMKQAGAGAASAEPYAHARALQEAAGQTEKKSLGSTQVTLAPQDAKIFVNFARNRIKPDEVYNDEEGHKGREKEPHVTALYGLTGNDPAVVREAIAGTGPVKFKLGKLSLFENADKPYDVLKVDVISPDLHALNAKLRKLPNETDFPDYHPHLTLAYVKKGAVQRLVGKEPFAGREFTIDTLTFSDAERNRTAIPLRAEDVAGDVANSSAAAAVAEESTAELAPMMGLARFVMSKITRGEKFSLQDLYDTADKVFKGRQSEGAYTFKDASDAMELGVSLWLAKRGLGKVALESGDVPAGQNFITSLKRQVLDLLPTQGRQRNAEMEQWQQFSTPPTLAFAANWAANPHAGELMFEPSAGLGSLAVFAQNAGAKVFVNELAPRRAEALGTMGFTRVFTEDAEQLNNILPPRLRPTVVVMNPPFSQTAGRMGAKRDLMVGARHIDQMLKRLNDGGRLVAVVGRGMTLEAPTFRDWWKQTRAKYNVRAVVGVSGAEYAKYGTHFDNLLLVIDKTGPTTAEPITAAVDTVEQLLPILKEVRDDRAEPNRSNPPAEMERVETRPGATGDAAGSNLAPVGGGKQRDAGEADRIPGRGGPSVRAFADGASGVAATSEQVSESTGPGERENAGGRGAGDLRGSAIDGERSAGSERGGGVEATVERAQKEHAAADAEAQVFDRYQPSIKVKGSKPNSTPLAESAAMASVDSPAVKYAPKLDPRIITEGLLSDAQLEAVVLAGAAHERTLPSGERQGFFDGDGTGVGKNRTATGIFQDNWNRGRRKGVWISENMGLLQGAKKAVQQLRWNPDVLLSHAKIKSGEPITAKQGILFTTYNTLAGKSGDQKTGVKRRIDQIVTWLGKDFDGVVAFDESHKMGNVLAQKGPRGISKPSEMALAGVELQKALPKARVVYLSATGATDVRNLAYAERLGLWGPGTPFNTVRDFVTSIEASGVAAMEMVARDMKAMGLYVSRSIAYNGVEYDKLTHALTPEQVEIYDELAGAWQLVLENMEAAMGETKQGKNGGARSAASSKLWGAHQRFFMQVTTAMQLPSVIRKIEESIAAGRAPVLQIVNTNEAQTKATMAEKAAEALETGEDVNYETMDMTPRRALMDYIERGFPTAQYEEYADEEGRIKTRPAVDSHGKPVQNAEAVRMREALLEKLARIRVPENPLDAIIDHFGADRVAEVTGRTVRIVRRPNAEGAMEKQREGWSKVKGLADAAAFQDGKRDILIFSAAGGTGMDYHADLSRENQKPRDHIVMQSGWRADSAVQGFGRTHRNNQKQPPKYYLASTNLEAQKRFISTIARRLDSLGALTKGQRDTGSQGMMNAADNLENEYAVEALKGLYRDLIKGQVEAFTLEEFEKQTGQRLRDKDGNLSPDAVDIKRFLNRLLNFKVEMMNKVWRAFFERFTHNIEAAQQRGELDFGMETIKALKAEVVREEQLNRDERSGSTTDYKEVQLTQATKIVPFKDLARRAGDRGFYQNTQSGVVWAHYGSGNTTDRATGAVTDQAWLTNHRGSNKDVAAAELADAARWKKMDNAEARPLVEAAIEKTPKTRTETAHMITGVLLPIWNRLHGNNRVYRIGLDNGERLLGRRETEQNIGPLLQQFELAARNAAIDPAQVVAAVNEGQVVKFADGTTLRTRAVYQDKRIEITGPKAGTPLPGGFGERIQYEYRYFIRPAQAAEAVKVIAVNNPPVSGLGGDIDALGASEVPAAQLVKASPASGPATSTAPAGSDSVRDLMPGATGNDRSPVPSEEGPAVSASATGRTVKPAQPWKDTATPAKLEDFTPDGRRAVVRLRRIFGADRQLFEAFGVSDLTFVKLPGRVSGIQTFKGLRIDGDQLARNLAELEREGGDADAWLTDSLTEEVIHLAQVAAASRATNGNAAAYYQEVWRSSMPEGLRNLARRSYVGFDELSDAAKGIEVTRMVIQGRWQGTITEQIFRAIRDLFNFLRGIQIEASPLLHHAVRITEAALDRAGRQVIEGRLTSHATASAGQYETAAAKLLRQQQPTKVAEPTAAERTAIRRSYETLASQGPFKDVAIADVLEGAGFTLDEVDRGRGAIVSLWRAGEIPSLASGDWSLADPRKQAWGVIPHGSDPALMMRMAEEEPEGLEASRGPEGSTAIATSLRDALARQAGAEEIGSLARALAGSIRADFKSGATVPGRLQQTVGLILEKLTPRASGRGFTVIDEAVINLSRRLSVIHGQEMGAAPETPGRPAQKKYAPMEQMELFPRPEQAEMDAVEQALDDEFGDEIEPLAASNPDKIRQSGYPAEGPSREEIKRRLAEKFNLATRGAAKRPAGAPAPAAPAPASTPSPVTAADAPVGPLVRTKVSRLYLGAADVFEEIPGLTFVGTAIRKHIDLQRRWNAYLSTPWRRWVKKHPRADRKVAMKEYTRYWQIRDGGNEQEAAELLTSSLKATQELAAVWEWTANYCAEGNRKLGIKNFHAESKQWRLTGKVAAYTPRVIRRDIMRAIQNPARHPEAWAEVVNALIEEKLIQNKDEALAWVDANLPTETRSDFMGSIERARTLKLPTKLYDYSPRNAVRYIARWTERAAQIAAYGQKTTAESKTLFDKAREVAKYDERTVEYISHVEARVYDQTPRSVWARILSALNSIATGTMLANPITIGTNFTTGTGFNFQHFGFGNALMGSLATFRAPFDAIEEAYVRGIIQDDLMDLTADVERLDSPLAEKVQTGASFMLKWSGYNLSEVLVRAQSLQSVKVLLRHGLKALKTEPDGLAAREFKAFVGRHGQSVEKLVAEDGDGPKTDAFYRRAVNEIQGGYRIDQTPVFANTPLGRFLLKFQKWGLQMTRAFMKHVIDPARAGDIRPLIRFAIVAALVGSTVDELKELLFGAPKRGASWDEIGKTMDENESRGLVLAAQKAWLTLLSAGSLGALGNMSQMTLDVYDRSKFKSPLDPPGMALVKNVGEMGLRAIEQGTLTAADFNDIARSQFGMVRTVESAGAKALTAAGVEARPVQIEMARQDSQWLGGYLRRFASEHNAEGGRTSLGRAAKTPDSPFLRELTDSLMIGDAEAAKEVAREHLANFQGKAREVEAERLRDIIRSRQPVKIRGASDTTTVIFLDWAKSRLPAEDVARIRKIDQTYRQTAHASGLMKAPQAVDPRRLEEKRVKFGIKHPVATP